MRLLLAVLAIVSFSVIVSAESKVEILKGEFEQATKALTIGDFDTAESCYEIEEGSEANNMTSISISLEERVIDNGPRFDNFEYLTLSVSMEECSYYKNTASDEADHLSCVAGHYPENHYKFKLGEDGFIYYQRKPYSEGEFVGDTYYGYCNFEQFVE